MSAEAASVVIASATNAPRAPRSAARRAVVNAPSPARPSAAGPSHHGAVAATAIARPTDGMGSAHAVNARHDDEARSASGRDKLRTPKVTRATAAAATAPATRRRSLRGHVVMPAANAAIVATGSHDGTRNAAVKQSATLAKNNP